MCVWVTTRRSTAPTVDPAASSALVTSAQPWSPSGCGFLNPQSTSVAPPSPVSRNALTAFSPGNGRERTRRNTPGAGSRRRCSTRLLVNLLFDLEAHSHEDAEDHVAVLDEAVDPLDLERREPFQREARAVDRARDGLF